MTILSPHLRSAPTKPQVFIYAWVHLFIFWPDAFQAREWAQGPRLGWFLCIPMVYGHFSFETQSSLWIPKFLLCLCLSSLFIHLFICLLFIFHFLPVWGIEPRASHLLGKCSTTNLHLQPLCLLSLPITSSISYLYFYYSLSFLNNCSFVINLDRASPITMVFYKTELVILGPLHFSLCFLLVAKCSFLGVYQILSNQSSASANNAAVNLGVGRC